MIFVIIAIVIVAGVIVYFLVREKIVLGEIPSELRAVFDYYGKCIEQEARAATESASSQGGFVEVPAYAPGSEYAPFSSQLNFLGFPIPYWYYISGNGLIKEQAPRKGDIENGIANYVRERIKECDFSSFNNQGFIVELGNAEVDVEIDDNKIGINVDSSLAVSKGEVSGRKDEYNVKIDSKLGKFYSIAKKIYEKEKKDAILDKYGEDVLRLYAPVDGVEISCSGKIWKTGEVVDELKKGLEANIGSLKFKGDYYELSEKKREYFVIDIENDIDENVNLIYSKTMPTKIEISGEGVDESLMIAEPVGIQEGLGILGFCYSPYHFVYDLSFPVLIQIFDGNEMFQFPVVVTIDNNIAREGIYSEIEIGEGVEEDVCEFMTQDIEVNLYDISLNRVDGNISYVCFNQRCRLGESKDGKFVGKAPSCLNGYLLIRGSGFAEKQELFSTNKESNADVLLDREYDVEIDLEVGGKKLDGNAIISFARDNGKVVSTALPDVKKIKLSEGSYDVTVYVYGNSSITIPGSTKTECREVPRSGIAGFFGGTKEECFDIKIPETKIDYALRGGGRGNVYLLGEQLEDGKIRIEVKELLKPGSLEELQNNYAMFELNKVVVE